MCLGVCHREPCDVDIVPADFLLFYAPWIGTKLHLGLHFAPMKIKFGADPYLLDTERTERMHKFFVKEAFNATNKQKELETWDMMRMVTRKQHADKLFNMYIVRESSSQLPPDDTLLSTRSGPWELLAIVGNHFEVCGTSRKPNRFDISKSPYLHPMWKLSELYGNIARNVPEDGAFRTVLDHVWKRDTAQAYIQLRLLRQEKCVRDGMDSFTIICDQTKAKNMKRGSSASQDSTDDVSSFSIVNIDVKKIGEANLVLQPAKVMCIFEFTNLEAEGSEEKRVVYVMVGLLNYHSPKTLLIDTYLPYDKVTADLDSRRGLLIAVVPIESIVQPLFAIPWYKNIKDVDRDRNGMKWADECTLEELRNRSFFYYVISPSQANTLSNVMMVPNWGSDYDPNKFALLYERNDIPLILNPDEIEYLAIHLQPVNGHHEDDIDVFDADALHLLDLEFDENLAEFDDNLANLL